MSDTPLCPFDCECCECNPFPMHISTSLKMFQVFDRFCVYLSCILLYIFHVDSPIPHSPVILRKTSTALSKPHGSLLRTVEVNMQPISTSCPDMASSRALNSFGKSVVYLRLTGHTSISLVLYFGKPPNHPLRFYGDN